MARTLMILACVSVWLPTLPGRADGGGDVPLALRLRTLSGGARRFTVVGTNALESMHVGRWADEVAARVEGITGMALPQRGVELRVSVYAPEEPTDTAPWIDAWRRGAALVYRLHLDSEAAAWRPEAATALCGLLAAVYLAPLASTPETLPAPAAVPGWLAAGLAANLDRDERAANHASVAALWERGGLGSMSGLADGLGALDPLADRALCGVLVDWWLESPHSAERFEALCRRLAAGGTIDAAWLAGQLPDARGPAGLDALMDAWMLRRRRTVWRPGRTSAAAVERLAVARLLYPGSSGIPLDEPLARGAGFGVLIEHRGASWMPAFSRGKIAELRLLAVGRDEAFRAVVDAYVAFLAALERGAAPDNLAARLRVAEHAFDELERRIRAEGAASAPEEHEAQNGRF